MRYSGNNIKLMVNNLIVGYTDDGPAEAPVIIFIHGFPLNKTMWDKQVNALKKNYRVVAYDIRGHGDSEIGSDDFSIELFVIDLIELMNVLQIEKASLCGLSMGGYIALNAIENHPERFNALVLSDTNCIADPPQVKEKRLNSIERIWELGVKKYVDDSIVNLFASESFTTHTKAISAVKEMILNTSQDTLCKTLLALCLRKETCNKLPQITIPVLFLVGEKDKITPPEATEMMHEKINYSTKHIISHAGHLSNMENPKDFNTQLKNFLAIVQKDYLNSKLQVNTSIIQEIRNKLGVFLYLSSV